MDLVDKIDADVVDLTAIATRVEVHPAVDH